MARADAAAMLRRIAVDGPHRAHLDGREVLPLPGASGAVPVLDALAMAMYQACYAGLAWPADPSAGAGRSLAPELRAASAGNDGWQGGWSYVRTDLEGRIVARRGTALRGWWPGQVVRDDGVAGPLVEGTPLRAFLPAVPAVQVQPGFWFVHGFGAPDVARRRLRLYFNVGAEGAAALVRALTSRLHALEVPFTLKVADHEAYARRRDSAVLWTEARHFRVVSAIVAGAAGDDGLALAAETPPFTKPMLPGVGLAEDPRGGMSFGIDRCGAVAEGAWLAATEEATDERARLDAVERAFAARGLDLDRPWLAARTDPDRYELAAA